MHSSSCFFWSTFSKTPPILVVILDIPGFDKKSIKTRLNESTLTISANREPQERTGVSHWEQRPLKVNKRIQIPIKVKIEEDTETRATYENGVLTIRPPMKGTRKIIIE